MKTQLHIKNVYDQQCPNLWHCQCPYWVLRLQFLHHIYGKHEYGIGYPFILLVKIEAIRFSAQITNDEDITYIKLVMWCYPAAIYGLYTSLWDHQGGVSAIVLQRRCSSSWTPPVVCCVLQILTEEINVRPGQRLSNVVSGNLKGEYIKYVNITVSISHKNVI